MKRMKREERSGYEWTELKRMKEGGEDWIWVERIKGSERGGED